MTAADDVRGILGAPDDKGEIRVDLSGGYVTLRLNVNLSTLRDADRAFVLDLLHRVISRTEPTELIDGSK